MDFFLYSQWGVFALMQSNAEQLWQEYVEEKL